VSWPAAGAALTGEILAADFGRKTPAAHSAIAAFQKAWSARARSEEATDDPAAGTALRTYYALLVKLIGIRAAGMRFRRLPTRDALEEIENGHVFRAGGVPNFLEGDESWYLTGWNRDLEDALTPLIQRVQEYALPNRPADIFRQLYLDLFSSAMRHGLGEYYTPDWLAEQLLAATMGPDLGDPQKRVLDPACGSGVFLVRLIERIRSFGAREKIPAPTLRELIFRHVAGFEVNPLAVMTARANYLLASGEWREPLGRPVEIPVYHADSAMAPPEEFAHACDFVVGNPPWVNWENLSDDYRRATRPLWERYSLLPKRAKAMDTILGGAKYDLAMLLTYVAADRFLKVGGKVGFLAPQTLFKSPKAGQGFRRFRLPDGTPIGPCMVEDFSDMRPFRAANRTAAMVLEKGKEPRFPVAYHCFRRKSAEPLIWEARPISTADSTSSWMTGPARVLDILRPLLGSSPYRAREGANTGGANGVFWVHVGSAAGDLVRIRNLTERARVQVPAVRAAVESCLVFPLLRGQNVRRWSAEPVDGILLPHQPGMKLRAIPMPELTAQAPRSFAYLKRFEPLLRRRAAFRRYFRRDAPFYSLFNIGDYTFAPWKVVWREQAWPFTAAVCGTKDGRTIIPDHKLMLVPAASEVEAYFLCAVLNSLPVSASAAAYTVSTQIGTHILEFLAVPEFSGANPLHIELADASRRAHAATLRADQRGLQQAERQIEERAGRLWGLTTMDVDELRGFLTQVGLTLP